MKLFITSNSSEAGSSLLELVAPLNNDYKNESYDLLSAGLIASILTSRGELGLADLSKFIAENPREGFSTNQMVKQLRNKFLAVATIESFLMETQGGSNDIDFLGEAQSLAEETLAYFLATEADKLQLRGVFANIAARIGVAVPDKEVQSRFGKTLLGIDQAIKIDEWVRTNQFALFFMTTEDELFGFLSPLLFSLTSNSMIKASVPITAIPTLVKGWLNGDTYEALLKNMTAAKATYPYGKQRRKFNIDTIVGICESVFSYEFPLYLAAVCESIMSLAPFDEGEKLSKPTQELQKRLKYGLSDRKSVLLFELGFAERVVAQAVGEAIWDMCDTVDEVRRLLPVFEDEIREILQSYPSFFADVFNDILAKDMR